MSYDFLEKKFFCRTPRKPPGGYFKDFRLIFTILGFKELKMGQKRKFLSQISCILMKYNIIIHKKIRLTPQTPHEGRQWGNLCGNLTFFTVFCLNHSNTTRN